MTDDHQSDSNLIVRVIFWGMQEIIDYLKKNNNFSLSYEVEKELKKITTRDTHLSLPSKNIEKKKITIHEPLPQSQVSLKRPVRLRGNVNDTLCNYTRVQSCEMLKRNHDDWLEKINQDNRDIKTAYDEYNIVFVCQYCKLTIERTNKLILDKILFDKDEKLIGAFIKTKEYYDSKKWDGYPLIFIKSQGSLNNSKRYSKFCNGYYLDKEEYKKSNITFYLYLILEYILCDFYNRRKDMKDYYLYFRKINRYRNASRESGHDSEKQVDFENFEINFEIEKLKNFLEWFVNDIAYSCLNK